MNHLLWMLICASLCMLLVEPSQHNIQNPTYHDHHQDHDHAAAFVSPTCHGSDCYEMMMEPKSSRRILADAGYISYGALRRDNTPCSLVGNSYYNCNSRQQANPYNRGCTKITYCARNSHWFLALVGGNINSHHITLS